MHSNGWITLATFCSVALRTRSTVTSADSFTSCARYKHAALRASSRCAEIVLPICIGDWLHVRRDYSKTQSIVSSEWKEFCASSAPMRHYAVAIASRQTSAERSSAQSQQSVQK